MNKKNVLIISATSDIAVSTAEKFASKGFNLILTARNKSKLYELEKKLKKFNVKIITLKLDILNISSFNNFISNLNPTPNIVICATGLLGNQKSDQGSTLGASRVIMTNFAGPAILLNLIASKLEQKGEGTIVGISSIAGVRGRASNYIYGSSKAGLTNFLSGLRNRLSKKNINVITILPGFVKTKMTKGLNLPKFLTNSSESIGEVIYESVVSQKNIVYPSFVWKMIAIIIHFLPESIFKRLNL